MDGGDDFVAEKYDIYYLSPPGDAKTAQTLAESIRLYRLPKGIKPAEDGMDYRRTVLDLSGEPVSDELLERLNQSRCLVLFCSPDTRNDPVILEKMAHFVTAHGQERIVAVMVRGEPVESFPESFIEKKVVRRIMPDMSVVESVDTIEPVAADLRGNTPKRRKQLLRYETVRITASVLGLHPDALEQRHRARRRRAITAALTAAGAVCLTAAAIFLRLGWIAREEGNIAAEQTKLSVQIAARTMEELPAAFAGEPDALDYIDEAVENARKDLDELGLGGLLGSGETEG